MPTRHVVIDLKAGTPVHGRWCDACLLPSSALVPIHMFTDAGVETIATVAHCTDCGTQVAVQP